VCLEERISVSWVLAPEATRTALRTFIVDFLAHAAYPRVLDRSVSTVDIE